jgi:hypothetical protein
MSIVMLGERSKNNIYVLCYFKKSSTEAGVEPRLSSFRKIAIHFVFANCDWLLTSIASKCMLIFFFFKMGSSDWQIDHFN